MSIGEAARCLGMSVSSLRRLEARGIVRAIRTPGRHRRFVASEITALARLSEQKAAVYTREKLISPDRASVIQQIQAALPGLVVSDWIEESEVDCSRPLPQRQGFVFACSLAAGGFINSLVVLDPRLIAYQHHWLGILSMFGLNVFEVRTGEDDESLGESEIVLERIAPD